MTLHLVRSISKTVRTSSLGRIQKRNSSTNASNQPNQPNQPTREVVIAPATGGSSGMLKVAVGLSLGLGLYPIIENVRDNLNPKEKPQQKNPEASVDNRIFNELLSYMKETNAVRDEFRNFKEEVRREQSRQIVTQTSEPPARVRSDVDVFELSQVIEANNLANLSTKRRELEALRRALSLDYALKLEGEMLKVENKYRPVINKIKELETHLETQLQNKQKEAPAKLLWVSCQGLLDRLKKSNQGPLEQDPAYGVLKQLAADNNQLANSVLDAIPAKALKQGVESEDSLIDRFSKVEKICRRVALIDERGGNVKSYLLSYLQSLFIFDTSKGITEDELVGRHLVDPTTWNTFDILARVKISLSRHNLDLATRYANQLRGQARAVARDWIRDARIHLEVAEAFKVMSSYAEAVALDSLGQSFANK